MNPKIANLLAIETGILVGLMSWLTYSHLPSSEPRAEAGTQGNMAAPVRAAGPVNSVAPPSEAISQRPSIAEYSAEREQARLMAERSASLQSYYREIARESATTAALETASTVADSPTYAGVNPEPAALADEYVAPPPAFLYYAPAAVQNVIFADSHRLRNHPGRIGTTTPQCPDRRNLRRNDRVVSPNPVPPPPRVTQGPDPRGTVRQPGVTAVSQKRAALPPSRGSGRNAALVP